MSIDTTNSAEILAGSHIREELNYTFCRFDPHELLHVAVHVPHKDDLSWYDGTDFLDNYHDWNESPNTIDTVNSAENITGVHVTNQEHQNYYDRQDQQYIACKYNGDLEQVALELAPDIIVEEEKDGFY